MKIPDKRFVVSYRKFEERIRVRPVSNVVLLPRRTKLIELNSTQAQQQLDLFSNVALPPCRTQFINYTHVRIHLKSLPNRFFIFVFYFRQQPSYSTELNSTSETKSCQCRAVVELQSSQLSTTFETGLIQNVEKNGTRPSITRSHTPPIYFIS